MDKDRAKFILRNFRPDGADSKDVDFAEALLFATEDRELGAWLVRERAFDAEFAEAMARVSLPEGLRESVLLSMVQDGGDFPKVDMQEEGRWINALATIEVPVGLRDSVLEAMSQTAKARPAAFSWRRLSVPMAAAAGIVLALILIEVGKDQEQVAAIAGEESVVEVQKGVGKEQIQLAATGGKVNVADVQAGFVRTFESPIFSLDKTGVEMPKLVSYLRERGLPCGEGLLPPGLDPGEGLGCRELIIDGKRGTLICFDKEDGVVHLVIFKRSDVEGELPGMASPVIEQSGDWAKASWEKGNYVFSLMGVRDKEELAAFF